jgi:methionyl-tRNA formyltransferase
MQKRSVKKIVFLGSDPIGLDVLRWLAGNGGEKFHLVAAVSGCNRPSGRGMRLHTNPIAEEGARLGLKVFQPQNPRGELLVWLGEMSIDIGIVFAYGHILSQQILDALPMGFVNLHASPLPKLRGPSPIEGAILTGRTETAVTLMRMVREMDAGAILGAVPIPMTIDERASVLRNKVSLAAVQVLDLYLNNLLDGNLLPVEQNAKEASYTRIICKNDGFLDFNQPAGQLDAQIRAYELWPGSFFPWNGENIRVGKAEIGQTRTTENPGTIIGICDGALEIAAGQGSILRCQQLQRPTRRMLPAQLAWPPRK